MTIVWLRTAKRTKKESNTVNDVLYAIGYIAFNVGLIWFVMASINHLKLSVVVKFAMLCEHIRIVMKLVSYARESHRILMRSSKSKFPTRKSLLYFLFAPTLIYKSNYPQTKSRNWSQIAAFFVQFLTTIYITFVLVRYAVIPSFAQAGLEPIQFRGFLHSIVTSMLVGGVFLIMVFYGFLHCWLNMWAELLKFSDRMFYEDWWNSTNYAKYFRKWNLVVHDWIYTYIYGEVVTSTHSRALAGFA